VAAASTFHQLHYHGPSQDLAVPLNYKEIKLLDPLHLINSQFAKHVEMYAIKQNKN
jgi:hypothetical protein